MMYPQLIRLPLGGIAFVAALLSCVALPAPPPPALPPAPAELPPLQPRGDLRFDRAEAGAPGGLVLFFLVTVENPRSVGARLDLGEWRAAVDGREVRGEAAFVLEGAAPRAAAASATAISLGLTLDMAEFVSKGGEAEEVLTELTVELAFSFDHGEPAALTVSAWAALPRIREPEFAITGIVIMKAELINTRLKLGLRVHNPNRFPLSLSALSYELYGQGRLWGEGRETEILLIPPEDSVEKELRLVMNFIDMDRKLLDRIIALGRLPYRFAGEAEAVLDVLPPFRIAFDRSGVAEVID